MTISCAIIIPCKNEAENIGRLFDSILMQENIDIKNIPIFVADANSTDNTLEIISGYNERSNLNITVVQGGYPATGRNIGASHAHADYLIFIDADITLGEPLFLYKVIQKINSGDFHLITSYIRCRDGNWFDTFFWKVHAASLHISKLLKPMATGMFMVVRTDIFKKTGGFDESVILGEDVEFSHKIHRKYFGIVDTWIYTTNRRFKKMGYVNTIVYYTMVAFSSRFRHRDNAFYFDEKDKAKSLPENMPAD